MSNYGNQREDKDYEALDADRRNRDDRRRSRSQSRNSRQNRDVSRSRSRSSRRRRHHRSSYSRSRSNSRSRSHSRGYSSSRRGSGRYSSRRHRDSRSKSRSLTRRSNSRSRSSYKYSTRRHSRSRSRTPTRSRHTGNNYSRGRRSQSKDEMTREQGRNKNENTTSMQSIHEDGSNTSSSYADITVAAGTAMDNNELHNLPLPKRRNEATSAGGAVGRGSGGRGSSYYNYDTDEPIDKERIHREMEEKLRLALAKEGKVYPPPKPEASHPVFANDGSFLEIFKKMQQQQQQHQPITAPIALPILASTSAGASTSVVTKTVAPPPPPPPIVGRRRGGKILKTGVVAKPKVQQESGADPKDFWSLYLAEVNKYKNNACESDGGTRPLVK